MNLECHQVNEAALRPPAFEGEVILCKPCETDLDTGALLVDKDGEPVHLRRK